MLVYNVTINIDEDVHEEWLSWMKTTHIPRVMECGLFESNKMLRIIADDEGATYSIQYSCSSMDKLETYFKDHAPLMQQEHTSRYGDKFVAFRTILEEVT